MKIGAIVPQGWVGEYDGWDPLDAWRRTTEVARQADRLGFESIWLFDHFQTVPKPTDEITFESFTSLAALAALTERVRLGHIVICTGGPAGGIPRARDQPGDGPPARKREDRRSARSPDRGCPERRRRTLRIVVSVGRRQPQSPDQETRAL